MSTDFTKPFSVTLAELSFRPRDNHDAAFIKATAISLLTEGQNESLKLAAKIESGQKVLAKNASGQTDVFDGNGRCEAVKLLINDGVRVKDIKVLTDGGTFFLPEAEVRSVQTQTASEDFVFLPADFKLRAELALDGNGNPQTREESLLVTCEFRRGLSMREGVRTVKKVFDVQSVALSEKEAIKYLSLRFNLTKQTIRKYLWIYKLPQADQDDFFNRKTTFTKLRAVYDKNGQPKPPKPMTAKQADKLIADRCAKMWEAFVQDEYPEGLEHLTDEQWLGAKQAISMAFGTPSDIVKTFTGKPAAKAKAAKAKKKVKAPKPTATYTFPAGVEWVRLIENVDTNKIASAAFSGKAVRGDTTLDVGSRLLEVRAVEDSPTEQHYEADFVMLLADGTTTSLVKIPNWNNRKNIVQFVADCAAALTGDTPEQGKVVTSPSTAPAEKKVTKKKVTKKKATKKKATVTGGKKAEKPVAKAADDGLVRVSLANTDSASGWHSIDRIKTDSVGDPVLDMAPLTDGDHELEPGAMLAYLDSKSAGSLYVVGEDGLDKQGDINDEWDLLLSAAEVNHDKSLGLLENDSDSVDADDILLEPGDEYDASNTIPSNLPTFDFGMDD